MTIHRTYRTAIACLIIFSAPAGHGELPRDVAAADAPPTGWMFSPEPDTFGADAAFDLRSLNEKTAGQSGFVRVSPEGDLLLGDGRPARFWGITTYVGREQPFVARPLWAKETAPDLARHARFLAKRGVNIIKVLAAINPDPKKRSDAALNDIRSSDREWIWKTVAAMKNEGIYTVISPWWPAYSDGLASWELGTTNLHALTFFDDRFQSAYREWLRALFTEVNPYTGLPLAQDPAVAFTLLVHEDSLLFYTLDKVKGPPRERLEARYRSWLEKRHGSLGGALAAWGVSEAEASPLLLPIHELTPQGSTGSASRLADQTRFLVETQRGFYDDTVRFLRSELGVRSLICAGDWRTAHDPTLAHAERSTYLPGDIDGVDRYAGGPHVGPRASWAVNPGDHYASRSVLDDPASLPLNYASTRGRPMVMLESGWTAPNAYETEGPLLVAAYSALTGFDGFLWFATRHEQWAPPASANGYQPGLPKWEIATPAILGQFPALALAYRRGDIARGVPVHEEHRSSDDLINRRLPRLPDASTMDTNPAAAASLIQEPAGSGTLPRESFLIGPSTVTFDSDSALSRAGDTASFLDASTRRVRSNTGELVADPSRRLFTMDTPSAQGAAAFWAQAGRVDLSTLSLEVHTPYATVVAVGLDGAPLSASRQVLVQVGTQIRPAGWRESPAQFDARGIKGIAGHRIESIGTGVWEVTRLEARLTLRNPRIRSAWQLDVNGRRVRPVPVETDGTKVTLTLPEDALYTLLLDQPAP